MKDIELDINNESFEDNFDTFVIEDDFNINLEEESITNDYSTLDMNISNDDMVLIDKDNFNIENLETNNYNKDILNEEKPSVSKKNFQNMNAIGNKKIYNDIEYINNNKECFEDYKKNKSIINSNDNKTELLDTSLKIDFYELEIDDYPKRNESLHSLDNYNKSLGDGNILDLLKDFFNKLLNIFSKK